MQVLNGLKMLMWTLAVFCYYFQVPFMQFAPFITISLGAFLILDIKKAFKIFCAFKSASLYFVIILLCLLNLCGSVINGVEWSNAVRFFFILALLPLCSFYGDGMSNRLYKIFAFFSFCKAVMLIIIAIQLISSGSYTELRAWARLNDYGDIYTVYGFIPKVQLKGNALLVVAFMISFLKNKKFTFYNSVVLLGVLSAGNFAFFLGVFLFLLWMYVKTVDIHHITLKNACVGMCILLTVITFSMYSMSESEGKSGYFGSNGMRILQYKALTDTNIFLGSGLGAPVYGASRLGRSIYAQYYELQPLYIYYQIGVILLLMFYIIMFQTMKKTSSTDGFIVFAIYLFYSFFNPYCFDTTQMMTMMMISNQFPRMDDGAVLKNT